MPNEHYFKIMDALEDAMDQPYDSMRVSYMSRAKERKTTPEAMEAWRKNAFEEIAFLSERYIDHCITKFNTLFNAPNNDYVAIYAELDKMCRTLDGIMDDMREINLRVSEKLSKILRYCVVLEGTSNTPLDIKEKACQSLKKYVDYCSKCFEKPIHALFYSIVAQKTFSSMAEKHANNFLNELLAFKNNELSSNSGLGTSSGPQFSSRLDKILQDYEQYESKRTCFIQ